MTPHSPVRIPLLLASLLVAGCPSAPEPFDRPTTFDEVRRIVTLGDNVGANPSHARSYVALLGRNDDVLFPAFRGKDLATRLPESRLVRADRGGASFTSLARAAEVVCRCAGDACPTDRACVDAADPAPTLVIVQLGGNDLFQLVMRMLNDEALRADRSAHAAQFRADVRKVLEVTNDPGYFRHKPRLAVTNVYDPSDGAGDLATLATTLFPVVNAERITPGLALAVIDEYNGIIREEAERAGALFVDVRAHFLGHGLHHADEANAHHDAADPTQWLRNVVDPNLRGAHEIRRVLWNALTGDDERALPGDLPNESTLGLPAVPANGWAKQVVDAGITPGLDTEDGQITNVAADPRGAIGEPDGLGGSVALGVVGA